MKCKAQIKRIGVKLDAESRVITDIHVKLYDADVKELRTLIEQPLAINIEPLQIEFGTGKPPEKKKK